MSGRHGDLLAAAQAAEFLRFTPAGSDFAPVRTRSCGDWEMISTAARRHGLASAVYARVLEAGDRDVPKEIETSLRRAYFAAFVHNTRLGRELTEVLSRFRRLDLPVMLLKGFALAAFVSGDLSQRRMCDVDLLVPRERLNETEAVLRELGFRPAISSGRLPRPVEIDRERELPQYGKPGGLLFDVHWAIEDPGSAIRPDISGLWSRSCPAVWEGQPVRIPCAEDLILHICVHAIRKDKLEGGLRPIHDLAVCAARLEVDWPALAGRAASWRALGPAYLALRLAGELFGAPIPAEVLASMRPPGFDSDLADSARRLVLAKPDLDCFSSPNQNILLGPGPLSTRLKSVVRRVFPSGERMARIYPGAKGPIRVFLHYPVLLAALTVRYGAWKTVRSYLRMLLRLAARPLCGVDPEETADRKLQLWIRST